MTNIAYQKGTECRMDKVMSMMMQMSMALFLMRYISDFSNQLTKK